MRGKPKNHAKYKILVLDCTNRQTLSNRICFTEYHEYTALFKIDLLASILLTNLLSTFFTAEKFSLNADKRRRSIGLNFKSISTVYCIFVFFFSQNELTFDRPKIPARQLERRTASNCTEFYVTHMFYMLYSGVRQRVGDRWRPIANQTLRVGTLAVGCCNFFQKRSTTVGGLAYASLNFRAQVHICARHPHTCTLGSILVWSLALIPRWLWHSSFFLVQKSADSRHQAYWLCTF